MARKKKKSLESKLGSWTDQATLTGTPSRPAKAKSSPSKSTQPTRENYLVSHSLIDRLADAAQKHGMPQNEVVGYLLTSALDQLEAGKLKLPTG